MYAGRLKGYLKIQVVGEPHTSAYGSTIKKLSDKFRIKQTQRRLVATWDNSFTRVEMLLCKQEAMEPDTEAFRRILEGKEVCTGGRIYPVANHGLTVIRIYRVEEQEPVTDFRLMQVDPWLGEGVKIV